MSKKLVAYFSPTGTTKKIAESIAEALDCPAFEIRAKVPYTKEDLDWVNPKSRSSVEMKDTRSRPEIEDTDAHIEQYDEIYLGFPVWWYQAPTVINTFLDQYDFTGKKIVLFATSGTTKEFGKTVEELEWSAPNAVFEEGMILTSATLSTINKWLKLIKKAQ